MTDDIRRTQRIGDAVTRLETVVGEVKENDERKWSAIGEVRDRVTRVEARIPDCDEKHRTLVKEIGKTVRRTVNGNGSVKRELKCGPLSVPMESGLKWSHIFVGVSLLLLIGWLVGDKVEAIGRLIHMLQKLIEALT